MMARFFHRTEPSLLRAWIVFIAASLFFFYTFIVMNFGNAINIELVKEFDFSTLQLSKFFASFAVGSLLFVMPSGMLLDRVSIRYTLLILFIITVGTTYVFSISSCFEVMKAMRFLTGAATACCFIAAIKIASHWFEPRHMAVAAGILVTMGMLGGIIAQAPVMLLIDRFDWRIATQIIAAFGVVLLIIQFLIVRDEPPGKEQLEVAEHQQLEKMGFFHSLRIILTNWQNWACGLYASLINFPMYILGSLWGVPYLTQVHGFSKVEAAHIVSMLFIGMMIGSPLAGAISDALQLRKLPMVIGALMAVITMAIIMYVPALNFMGGVVLFLVLGVMVSAQTIAFPVIAESNPLSITATATSLASTIILSSGLLVPTFGTLLDMAGNTTLVNGVKVYSQSSFLQANWLMLGTLLLALGISFLIRETRCKKA